MIKNTDLAYIALNRFGYGVQLKHALPKDPKAWLKAQIQPAAYPTADWTSERALKTLHAFRKLKSKEKKAAEKQGSAQAEARASMTAMTAMSDADTSASTRKIINKSAQKLASESIKQAIIEEETFQYRLVDFFSNHFSVSHNGIQMRALAPTLEREAIAPFIDTHFAQMLIAVESHPAMLYYLNNERSSGPNSKFAKKRKNRGLNENLAREILELHTLGVNGGYTQADVQELAKAITGWTIATGRKKTGYGFTFNNAMHEPGARTIMGKKYSQKRHQQGMAILKDLSTHPSTAQFISTKLARHFISDEPSQSLINAMTNAWMTSAGHLKYVLTAMIDHPDSWKTPLQKYKTPRDFIISACRACNKKTVPRPGILTTLKMLGQAPFEAGSPKGYGDVLSDWSGAEALITRIEWADHLSAGTNLDPISVVTATLGEHVSETTLTTIKRAESKEQGLALMLMSPEFLRR